jgi:sulfite exporter TauE/SafE
MSHYLLALVASAFMMGLLGGVHCIGMCGGIVCALCTSCSRQAQRRWEPLYYQLSYSLGRITMYSILGLLTGVIGVVLAQQMGSTGSAILRYLAAVLVILTGLYIGGWWQLISSFERFGKFVWRYASKLTRYLLPVRNYKQAFVLGGLWGLLPCGLVYSALLVALSSHYWLSGALVMFAFGLGTLPALLLVGSTMQSYQAFLAQKWVRRLSGLTLIVFGMLSIYFLAWMPAAMHACAHCG